MCLAPRSSHLLLTCSSLLLGVGLTGGRAGLGCGKLHLLLRGVWLPAQATPYC